MKIFVTGPVPQLIKERLEEEFDILYHDSLEPLREDEILEGAKDCEGILCPLSDKITARILTSNPQLKIVANYGAGFDNIDIQSAKEEGIVVTNAPAPSSAVSTAELTFGLLLASARHLVWGDSFMRNEKFQGWRPTFGLGHQLRGKTLGIFGLGNIGFELAKRAEAFGMNILYCSRSPKTTPETWLSVSFEELLMGSDFISLHSAYAPELHHLVDEVAFNKMKPSAIIINAARGPLVKEEALIQALREEKIAGAALDVYEFEPKFSKELLDFDNVILSPHLGNATYEARMEMGTNALENLLAIRDGGKAPNQVN
ncbi:MAG: NAD(P)-dependent oxidoreductase [Tissierellia bacterium]|nr:NAD(P)-dependent oxidoreductase [Tissierellia bacterium]